MFSGKLMPKMIIGKKVKGKEYDENHDKSEEECQSCSCYITGYGRCAKAMTGDSCYKRKFIEWVPVACKYNYDEETAIAEYSILKKLEEE